MVAGRGDVLANAPGPAKYFMCALSGIGPLWFIQLLWVLSLVLLILHAIDRKDKIWTFCGQYNLVTILLLGLFFWLGEQTLIMEPRADSADGLYNLYKPFFYLITFVMGYFVFSHDEVQEKVAKYWIPLMVAALISGIALIVITFGQDNTSPQYMASWLNCLYGWLMCLAMMGWFKAKFDYTGKFAGYMTKSSFGLYIVHYLVIASFGYMMKIYTSLPPYAMYLILTVAVFTISPLLYEVLHRIPFVRWCVFGEKGNR